MKDAYPNAKVPKAPDCTIRKVQVKELLRDPKGPPTQTRWGALRTVVMSSSSELGMDKLRGYALDHEEPPSHSHWDEILNVLND